MLQVNSNQWHAIHDITDVALLHDLHDLSVTRPDIDINLTVGDEGFVIEVIPQVWLASATVTPNDDSV